MQGADQKVNDQRAAENAALARRMREALRRARMTQTECANQMGERITALNRWLRLDGQGRRPGPGRLKHFAEVVGVPLAMIKGEEPFPQEPVRAPYERAVDMVDALANGEAPATAAVRAGVAEDRVSSEFVNAADEWLAVAQESLGQAWQAMSREEKLALLGDLMLRARRADPTKAGKR